MIYGCPYGNFNNKFYNLISKVMKTKIQFLTVPLKQKLAYFAGDIVELPSDQARQLIKAGVAKVYSGSSNQEQKTDRWPKIKCQVIKPIPPKYRLGYFVGDVCELPEKLARELKAEGIVNLVEESGIKKRKIIPEKSNTEWGYKQA